ncbi:binding-protein-dependent transport systems inner membrane component [Candidatus Moduliflexus flocculans]|uniref:Binding-protein-dependent transport systems inner membrane component n=1 Tax=Candidatus Moduliflexus flocculans TaxID=1499966 RepID=A0A081BP82_9BACT|nr:binding-protein-dependent transport systems inner membrane component [Candidatus Moduliflexus flocculans]
MLQYILRRLLLMVPTFFVISLVAFAIIQLPPGDFATSYVAGLAAQGNQVSQDAIETLRKTYGLGDPIPIQYIKWMQGILTRGDFGLAFDLREPVSKVIWERVWLTVALSLGSVIITWMIAFPIGIYSAVRQYSLGDYFFTLLGFIGIAVPSFLLALVLMYLQFKYFNKTIGGLFSDEFLSAPWSLARIWDLIQHLWIPVLLLAFGGTAELIRIMRANLLDEMRKPYVVTARSKGLPEWKVLFKYPVRLALNPFVSTIGWTLPYLVSGSIILSVVMNLPTTGPMLLRALQVQDMYLAGAIIMILSLLTIIGTLVSDVLLAWLDPRIRFHK